MKSDRERRQKPPVPLGTDRDPPLPPQPLDPTHLPNAPGGPHAGSTHHPEPPSTPRVGPDPNKVPRSD